MSIVKKEIEPGIYSRHNLIEKWHEKWNEIYGEGVCYASALGIAANAHKIDDLKIVLPKRTNCKLKQLALANCENVKEIYIQGTVSKFANQTFSNCKELKRIILVENAPETDITVSEYAFYDCSELTEVLVFCEGESGLVGRQLTKRLCDFREEKIVIGKFKLSVDEMLSVGMSIKEVNDALKLFGQQ